MTTDFAEEGRTRVRNEVIAGLETNIFRLKSVLTEAPVLIDRIGSDAFSAKQQSDIKADLEEISALYAAIGKYNDMLKGIIGNIADPE